MGDDAEYITMGEAADVLGLDRRQIRRLVQRMDIEQLESPLDARQRLIRVSELERLRPFVVKKAAA